MRVDGLATSAAVDDDDDDAEDDDDAHPGREPVPQGKRVLQVVTEKH